MTDKQKDLVVELIAGAILLLIGSLVMTSKWPLWVKIAAVVLIVLVVVIGIAAAAPVGRRLRQLASRPFRDSTERRSPAVPVDQMDPTWFVTFTSGPYPTARDPRGEYVTAIAAVDEVRDGVVTLAWRDRGPFPRSVPVKLLEAPTVYRFRGDGESRRRVRVQNDGLRNPAPGGVVTSSGWQRHRQSPHRIAFARYADLAAEQQKEMVQDADLATYDLDAL